MSHKCKCKYCGTSQLSDLLKVHIKAGTTAQQVLTTRQKLLHS